MFGKAPQTCRVLLKGQEVEWRIGHHVSIRDYQHFKDEHGRLYAWSHFEDGREVVSLMTQQAYAQAVSMTKERGSDVDAKEEFEVAFQSSGLTAIEIVRAESVADAVLVAARQFGIDHRAIIGVRHRGWAEAQKHSIGGPVTFSSK